MEEKELSPQESLDLINSMIVKARKRYSDNSFYYLLWGWLVIAACILHYWFAVDEIVKEPSMAWLVMFIGAVISIFHGMKQDKTAKVGHYTDKLYGWLWMSLGVAIIIVIVNGQELNFQIVPLILMLAGVGTFVSGKMMGVKVLQFGAICLWATAVLAFQLSEINQLLAMAGGITIGYLMPGYIMKANYNKENKA